MKQPNPLLDKLQEILPAIAANAVQAEQERKVPDENIRMLKSINLHRALQPKAYGGMEASLPEVTDCIAALAGACGGTAWAFSLLITHSHQMAMFSRQAQDEFWTENPDAVASSSIAPFGKVTETEGGVLFNGDMKWSSGCDHAEWAILGFLRDNPETGEKDYCFGVIPSTDYDIIDDWYSAGMKASGTKTLRIKTDTFIPEHRIEKAKAMMTGQSKGFGLYPDSKIYYTPYRPYFACGFAAMALGISERMLTVYKELTKNRTRAYTLASSGKEIPPLMRLAESTHQVHAARAFLEKTWNEHKEFGEQKRYPTDDELAFWRTNQAYAVKMCCEAVNRLFEVSGGSTWIHDNEIQRLWRDVNMTAAHAYTDYDVCKQILGRSLMGMEPDPTMV
ncbi:p-hydroxyphenylacetate 3-hydroxylase oxygenase component [Oceanospirillum sediminis]|uniref:Flavin-dependent monooxygenase n=1 Tax=Oceanospirillum sediminis TaxID=2760088 RepID=A0A839IXM3_9GAMM|nr:flavin-dependent monooxygenase [Oceanospirillum sediminis]MBB1489562.1 flavin-dependent monooxygenase [Oceanospirillum sediminis]